MKLQSQLQLLKSNLFLFVCFCFVCCFFKDCTCNRKTRTLKRISYCYSETIITVNVCFQISMNVKTAHVRTKDGALTVRDHSLVIVLMDGKGLFVIKVIIMHVIKLYCLFKEYHKKPMRVLSTIYSLMININIINNKVICKNLKNEVSLKPVYVFYKF